MDTGELVKLAATVLTLGAMLFGALRYAIRNEVKPALGKFSSSVNQLTATMERVDENLERAIDRVNDHEVRIRVVEDRQERRLA